MLVAEAPPAAAATLASQSDRVYENAIGTADIKLESRVYLDVRWSGTCGRELIPMREKARIEIKLGVFASMF